MVIVEKFKGISKVLKTKSYSIGRLYHSIALLS